MFNLFKAVIFDWAGTTMDYGCFAPAVAFMEVYKRQGVLITIEQAREPMGAHKKVHIRMISKIEAVAQKWEEKYGRRPTEEDVDRMFKDFIQLQLACLADSEFQRNVKNWGIITYQNFSPTD